MIFQESNKSFEVSSMDALNSVSRAPENQKKLTKTEAADFLKRLSVAGWLREDNHGYSLGLRSLLELKTYLTNEFDDSLVGECHVCKEHVLTPGYQSCSEDRCTCVMHKACSEKRFATLAGDKRCPVCKATWVDERPRQPAASRAPKLGRPHSQLGGMAGAPSRRAASEDDDVELFEDAEDREDVVEENRSQNQDERGQNLDDDEEEEPNVRRRRSGRR
ncbi:hypothetical protein DFJ74DRAFT_292043 [Hyaloraphidium curvatum]|nr:hypothetical protein DFJ74DRAFT_292043 [Hyaloraphidium curvatum]